MQIKIKHISHIFNKSTPWEFKALEDVSLNIEQGEYIGVIGSTGSGKTTLIEHLNNLLEPTSGLIEWSFSDPSIKQNPKLLRKWQKRKLKYAKSLSKQLVKSTKNKINKFKNEFKEQNYKKMPSAEYSKKLEEGIREIETNYVKNSSLTHMIYLVKHSDVGELFFNAGKTEWKSFLHKKSFKIIRQKVGVAFQFAEYQLFKATILEDIAFGPIAFGMSKEKAYELARKCLATVGMPAEYEQRSPFELSGGQKRRVALAGILAMQPDCLVVDEPTAGLDPKGVVEILDILSDLHKQGKTIINVTHDLDNILERANRILLLKDGKLILDDTPYNVLNNVPLLIENNLQPPKILEFVHELRLKGIPVPEVHSIEELASYLTKYRKEKNE